MEDYDDEIAAWAKLNKNTFINPTLIEQAEVQMILEIHPDLTGNMSSADPIEGLHPWTGRRDHCVLEQVCGR